MDTIPFILQLIQKNSIIYSIIISGNLNVDGAMDSAHVQYSSERAIYFTNFQLCENEAFDVMIIKDDTGFSLTICGIPKYYYERADYYFGQKTVYENALPKLRELNLAPELESHPYVQKLKYKYKIEKFVPPALITAITGSDCISIQFGDTVLDYMDMDKKVQKYLNSGN